MYKRHQLHNDTNYNVIDFDDANEKHANIHQPWAKTNMPMWAFLLMIIPLYLYMFTVFYSSGAHTNAPSNNVIVNVKTGDQDDSASEDEKPKLDVIVDTKKADVVVEEKKADVIVEQKVEKPVESGNKKRSIYEYLGTNPGKRRNALF